MWLFVKWAEFVDAMYWYLEMELEKIFSLFNLYVFNLFFIATGPEELFHKNDSHRPLEQRSEAGNHRAQQVL